MNKKQKIGLRTYNTKFFGKNLIYFYVNLHKVLKNEHKIAGAFPKLARSVTKYADNVNYANLNFLVRPPKFKFYIFNA